MLEARFILWLIAYQFWPISLTVNRAEPLKDDSIPNKLMLHQKLIAGTPFTDDEQYLYFVEVTSWAMENVEISSDQLNL